eukprot:CAMPEP_0201685432 /NCGR_PEP_ID=MMETSP0578-20130828/179_1 /ASSEMBLY_ACC=CAM_ASM_000663 /TAXON_ID=267565 /ORGANISM="Skeletonema grethea, Strain CCMP 1804" /LENGTH=303 /DNA_ID=CAMNT_0048169315 /DNA_START=23 /DNA_END=934 /DNA_ORIENTATION=+
MSSSSTIINSGAKTIGSPSFCGRSTSQKYYKYVSYHDSSVVSERSQASVIILFVVNILTSCTDYSDLAAKCVAGQSTVFAVVDNNPWSMVKISGEQTAEAFNDIVAHLNERLGQTVSSRAAIFIGGHSDGGYSAIAAMQENGGALSFKPAGFIGANPVNLRAPGVPSLKIHCPTFAIGFTLETCGVPVDQAALAAYNITASRNRVLMQIVNNKMKADDPDQITHCIFASDGLSITRTPHDGWVRELIGKFCTLFVDSVVTGDYTSKTQYEDAINEDRKSLVNVFFGAETATAEESKLVSCVIS